MKVDSSELSRPSSQVHGETGCMLVLSGPTGSRVGVVVSWNDFKYILAPTPCRIVCAFSAMIFA